MKKRHPSDSLRSLPFRPVIKYIIWLYVIIMIAELFVGSLYAIVSMKKEADFIVGSTKSQIDYRINNTVALLKSLTNDATIINPAIPNTEKAKVLTSYSEAFGYMMICLVDKEFNVWDEEGTDAKLDGRAYMQRLFTTGEVQITDSFAAGADGVTLNYTIAVPIFKNGEVDGCIFASIYFDEIETKLKNNIYGDYQQFIMYGSENQVMSVTNENKYGTPFLETMEDSVILDCTAKQIEEKMFARKNGNYWHLDNGNLYYSSYSQIEGTQWTLSGILNFWQTLIQFLPQILGLMGISSIACMVLVFLANKYIRSQMETVQMLITSVQELEKKIYQNERPDNVDFKEIISLTSKGLTDGLTGVITRTVFLNQIPMKIKSLKPKEMAAMCFIDVDDLKTLNDGYGHSVGDITLKNVGYVLREYEKKYDGLVGRHGGDEFIMFMMGFKSKEKLEEVIAEMTLRLHIEVTMGETRIPTHCSIGVSVCSNEDEDLDLLIKQADTMMYSVKQNGKGSYKIYHE